MLLDSTIRSVSTKLNAKFIAIEQVETLGVKLYYFTRDNGSLIDSLA